MEYVPEIGEKFEFQKKTCKTTVYTLAEAKLWEDEETLVVKTSAKQWRELNVNEYRMRKVQNEMNLFVEKVKQICSKQFIKANAVALYQAGCRFKGE